MLRYCKSMTGMLRSARNHYQRDLLWKASRMASFRTLDDLTVRGKRVLVRTDLNLPMVGGKVTDLTRLVRTAATLKELAEAGAKVVVMSHFGRPSGPDPKLSLAQLVPSLKQALPGLSVAFAADCVGPIAEAAVAQLADGAVL